MAADSSGQRARLELALAALLLAAGLCATGFVVVDAVSSVPHGTQLLGLALGLAFLLLAAACLLVARRFVPQDEHADAYPAVEHEPDQVEIAAALDEAAQRFTRRKLLVVSAGAAGTALGAALVAPVVSFGPVFDLGSFVETPWHRGLALVGEDGRPLSVDDVEEGSFTSAYPRGADREQLGAPLVLVRIPLGDLQLPPGREGWAPDGVLAYSKICTHAGCAISLYRDPEFPAAEPGPALVCPCHYSTFDPARGGKVLFGPAGRPLPQLPLELGPGGALRAAGTFSGPVGPAWWGVRSRRPT